LLNNFCSWSIGKGIFDVEFNSHNNELWGVNKLNIFNLTKQTEFNLTPYLPIGEKVKSFVVDRNSIWISTEHFIIIGVESDEMFIFKQVMNSDGSENSNNDQSLESINFIFADTFHRKWLSTKNKLMLFDKDKKGELKRLSVSSNFNNKDFTSVCNVNNPYEFWLITRKGDVHVAIFDNPSSHLTMTTFELYRRTELNNVKKIFYDGGNKVFLLSDKVGALSIIKPIDEDGIRLYSKNAEDKNNLFNSEWSHSITKHPKGVLIGTQRSGLYLFLSEKTKKEDKDNAVPLALMESKKNDVNQNTQPNGLLKSPILKPMSILIKDTIVFEIPNFEADRYQTKCPLLDSAINQIHLLKKWTSLEKVTIHGFASLGGEKNGIAYKRIGEVKSQLLKNGLVPMDLIKTVDHKDKDLLFPNDPTSVQNRRVRIKVEYSFYREKKD
jgi:hypothetical protein